MKINIGIVDDHQLFLKSLGMLIDSFADFKTVVDTTRGEMILQKMLSCIEKPDIMLVDVNMPGMDGPSTVKELTIKYPQIKTVALSMKDDDMTIIKMLQSGCCAYLLKDIHPDELERALLEIQQKGYYNADKFNINYRRLIVKANEENSCIISDREKEFLQFACSDLTYNQIASRMFLAERTIDGYRESLFEKLNVKSRVGMVLEAVRRNLVSLNQSAV